MFNNDDCLRFLFKRSSDFIPLAILSSLTKLVYKSYAVSLNVVESRSIEGDFLSLSSTSVSGGASPAGTGVTPGAGAGAALPFSAVVMSLDF